MKHINRNPPVHVLVASYLGYEYKDPIKEMKKRKAKEDFIFSKLSEEKEKLVSNKNFSLFSEDFRQRLEDEMSKRKS